MTAITDTRFSPEWEYTRPMRRMWNILKDTVPTTFIHVLPNSIRWFYRTVISKEITSIPLKATIGKTTKVATLYLHNDDSQSHSSLLFMHGDHGHPYTTLHLADLAEKHHSGRIFSLHMPYDDGYSESSKFLVKQAIDKIEELMKGKDSVFNKITAIGHSKGALQAAHLAFVDQDRRIRNVIAIAGRFKVVPSQDKPCPESIRSAVEAIHRAVMSDPHDRLFQIGSEADWCIPLEASIIKQRNSSIVPNAGHLGILYRKETVKALLKFIGQ